MKHSYIRQTRLSNYHPSHVSDMWQMISVEDKNNVYPGAILAIQGFFTHHIHMPCPIKNTWVLNDVCSSNDQSGTASLMRMIRFRICHTKVWQDPTSEPMKYFCEIEPPKACVFRWRCDCCCFDPDVLACTYAHVRTCIHRRKHALGHSDMISQWYIMFSVFFFSQIDPSKSCLFCWRFVCCGLVLMYICTHSCKHTYACAHTYTLYSFTFSQAEFILFGHVPEKHWLQYLSVFCNIGQSHPWI